MAMSTLKVTPQTLKRQGQQFDQDAKNCKNITEDMFELINGINGMVWSGDAANAYKNQFRELRDDANRLYKMVHEFAKDLQEVAKEYEAAEKANIATAQSLAKDVIN